MKKSRPAWLGRLTFSGAGEVLPAAGGEWGAATGGVDERDGLSAGERADARDADARNGARKAQGGRSGEEQLVVLATVQGEGEWVGSLRGKRMNRQRGGFNLRADAGFAAEVGEVGGEAVAEVDGGGGEAAAQQGKAHRKARLRIELRVRVGIGDVRGYGAQSGGFAALGQGRQLHGRAAQRAGDVEGVAGTAAAAAQGASSGSGAEENDIGEDVVGG